MGSSRIDLYNNIKASLQSSCVAKGYNMVLDFNNAMIQDKQAILLPLKESHDHSTFDQTRFNMSFEVRVIRFIRNETHLIDLFNFIGDFVDRLHSLTTMVSRHKVEYSYGNFGTSNDLAIVAKIVVEVE